MRRRYSIGIDPGASAAMALVSYTDAPGRRLCGVWSIYGGAGPRLNRQAQALQEVERLIGVRRNSRGDFLSSAHVDVWIELPAAGGASAANRNGWQVSLGRDVGRWEVHTANAFGVVARMIKANVWPRICGVRCGESKVDSGLHRINEARLRLDGAEMLVDGMAGDNGAARERRIARAEACLIALAGSK